MSSHSVTCRVALALVVCWATAVSAFLPTLPSQTSTSVARPQAAGQKLSQVLLAQRSDDVEEITKKYGLEAGLFSAFRNKDKEGGQSSTEQAKALLAKYGSAYLITSISLSLVSFALCYVLVDNGVDVAALLSKVGIPTTSNAETAGTVALAYAAHKAASPIRFPPTVALTPVVANLIGKKIEGEGGN